MKPNNVTVETLGLLWVGHRYKALDTVRTPGRMTGLHGCTDQSRYYTSIITYVSIVMT